MNDFYGNFDGGRLMNAFLANPSFKALYLNVIAGLSERRPLTVSMNDPTMGTVKVNTIDLGRVLRATAVPWTGKYYPEVPVILEAKPAPGYQFVGWQGALTSHSASLSVKVDDLGPTYQAVFAPASTVAAPMMTVIAVQTFVTGNVVNREVAATDPAGYELSYSAKQLPSGLSINADTGRIYGKPTKGRSFTSTLSATNGQATSSIEVAWRITTRYPSRSGNRR